MNTGRQCDGYQEPSHNKKKASKSQATQTPPPTNALSILPANAPYEARLLDFYCHFIVRVLHTQESERRLDIATPRPPDTEERTPTVFSSLATRLALSDPVTRDATIALAISFEAQTAGSPSQSHDTTILTHYNKAITGTRKRLTELTKENSSPNVDRWTALLVTILQFIGLELCRGDVESAGTHFQNFAKILETCKIGKLDVAGGSVTGNFSQLCFRMNLGLKTFPTFETFTRESPRWIDRPDVPPEAKPLYSSSQQDIVFSWYYLLADYKNLTQYVVGVDDTLTPESEALVQQMKIRIRDWYSALEFTQTARHKTGNRLPNAQESILRVHSKTMILRLEALLAGNDETCYDHLQSSFEEIMALARSVPITASTRQGVTWCHASTIASVFFIALKCRDGLLRREAVKRLGQWHMWQGLWHGRAMSCTVAKRIVEIEEQGQPVRRALDVLEISRVRDVKVQVDHTFRCVRLEYKAWAKSGSLRRVEEVIE